MINKLSALFGGLFLFAGIGSYAASEDELSKNPVYPKLKQTLAFYEQAANTPWPQIRTTRVLEVGLSDPEVAIVKKRLKITGELGADKSLDDTIPENDNLFNEELKSAVQLFQRRHGFEADGVVGPQTRHALNVTAKQRIHQIRVNLERWEEFIEQSQSQYIWINIPDYFMRLVVDRRPTLTSRVIVGKLSRETPEIASHIKNLIVNPSWTVPPGILKKDVIPRVIANPRYLSQHHMRIYSANHPGSSLKLGEIDLKDLRAHPGRYTIRQDPGPHNALGQIKFDFDNRHSVYLHDTPTKELFAQEKRLFSSGCIRLQHPLMLLESLGELDKSLSSQMPNIKKALQSKNTAWFKLAEPFPIHITYITVWVDDAGGVHFLDDVYNRGHQIAAEEAIDESNLPPPD